MLDVRPRSLESDRSARKGMEVTKIGDWNRNSENDRDEKEEPRGLHCDGGNIGQVDVLSTVDMIVFGGWQSFFF